VKYLLDTNICIALIKGKESALIDQFRGHQPNDFSLCSVVKAELFYGARKSQHVEANSGLLEKFFGQFNSLPFDDRCAERYGIIRAILEQAGTPIGANDLLIASIAEGHELCILTRNRKEFARVPGLRWEAW
jgi:tRNA(fMet)-specific endonuclease VapC